MSGLTNFFKSSPKVIQQPAAPVVAPQATEEEKKKRIGRASMYLTGPGGDLSMANTVGGKVLGN